MIVVETERLRLRRLGAGDAPFVLELVNEPSWLRYIGDKNVRSLADAERYIAEGPARSYAERGFGLYLVETRGDGTPIGICGLVKRDSLADVDIGFAFLPRYWKQGFAYESARAILDYGYSQLRLPRIVAVTLGDNRASIQLLERLGLRFLRVVRLGDDPTELELFGPAD
jgi:RimJ/RimL family protein N-acetyltransferase